MGWTTKPPAGTALDTSNHLYSRLVAYLAFLSTDGAKAGDTVPAPADAISGTVATAVGSGSATWLAGANGGLAPLMPNTLRWSFAGANYPGGPFTVSAWVWRNANDLYSTWLATGDYSPGAGWYTASGAGTGAHLACGLSNATARVEYDSASLTIAIGQWHHYAMSYDGASVVAFYLDGAPLGSVSNSFVGTASTTGLWVNGTKGGTGVRNIAVDNVAVFSVALQASDVASLYSSPWQLFAQGAGPPTRMPGRPTYRWVPRRRPARTSD